MEPIGGSLLTYAAEVAVRFTLELFHARSDLAAARRPSAPAAALAAADLGSNRGLGIFVSLGDRIAGFGAGGAELPGWPVVPNRGRLIGGPVLGDLDGDGTLEIVSEGTQGSLWAWTSAGALFPGFPRFFGNGAEVHAPLALSDIDGEPGVEIIVAETNGTVHAFPWNGIGEAPGWPVATGDPSPAGPVVAELAGHPVVVVAGSNAVHRIASDGTQLPSTPRIDVEGASDPALGDLDQDGIDEIVVAGASGAQAAPLSGAAGTSWQVLWTNPVVGPPLIGWFTASDTPGVAVPVGTRLQGIAGSGAPLPDFLPLSDGESELALVTANARTPCGCSRDGGRQHLYMYELHSGSASIRAGLADPARQFARTGSRLLSASHEHGRRHFATRDHGPECARRLTSSSNVLRWTAPSDVGGAGHAFSTICAAFRRDAAARELHRSQAASRSYSCQAPRAARRLAGLGSEPYRSLLPSAAATHQATGVRPRRHQAPVSAAPPPKPIPLSLRSAPTPDAVAGYASLASAGEREP